MQKGGTGTTDGRVIKLYKISKLIITNQTAILNGNLGTSGTGKATSVTGMVMTH